MDKVVAENSLPNLMDKMKSYVGREFTGSCPLTRVNFLKLYLACSEVWKDVAIKYDAKVPDELKDDGLMSNSMTIDRKVHICKAVEMFDLTAQDVDMKLQHKKKAAKLKATRLWQ
jgi:hypothetical protein